MAKGTRGGPDQSQDPELHMGLACCWQGLKNVDCRCCGFFFFAVLPKHINSLEVKQLGLGEVLKWDGSVASSDLTCCATMLDPVYNVFAFTQSFL